MKKPKSIWEGQINMYLAPLGFDWYGRNDGYCIRLDAFLKGSDLDNSSRIGFIHIDYNPRKKKGRALVDHVHINTEYRHSGMGSALYEFGANLLGELSSHFLMASTDAKRVWSSLSRKHWTEIEVENNDYALITIRSKTKPDEKKIKEIKSFIKKITKRKKSIREVLFLGELK